MGIAISYKRYIPDYATVVTKLCSFPILESSNVLRASNQEVDSVFSQNDKYGVEHLLVTAVRNQNLES